MRTKQIFSRLNRSFGPVLFVLIVGLLVVAGLIFAGQGKADDTQFTQTTSQLPQKTLGDPQFSFAGAPGWRQGPTDKVSMALFHGHDCFTSVEHKPGTVNVNSELNKSQTQLTSLGNTGTAGEVLQVKLQTSEGPRQYLLHQYTVSGTPGDIRLKGGEELGYLQLANGYIKISGECDTADQLSATIPALQSLKFNGVH